MSESLDIESMLPVPPVKCRWCEMVYPFDKQMVEFGTRRAWRWSPCPHCGKENGRLADEWSTIDLQCHWCGTVVMVTQNTTWVPAALEHWYATKCPPVTMR